MPKMTLNDKRAIQRALGFFDPEILNNFYG